MNKLCMSLRFLKGVSFVEFARFFWDCLSFNVVLVLMWFCGFFGRGSSYVCCVSFSKGYSVVFVRKEEVERVGGWVFVCLWDFRFSKFFGVRGGGGVRFLLFLLCCFTVFQFFRVVLGLL